MRFLFIDDDDLQHRGFRDLAKEHFPNCTVEVHTFESAVNIRTLAGFDYVFADLSLEKDESANTDEFPGISVVAQLRKLRGEQKLPYIVVITANREAFGRATVRRRLIDAGCEYFLRRQLLSAHLHEIVTPKGPVHRLTSESLSQSDVNIRLTSSEADRPLSVGKMTLGRKANLNEFAKRAQSLRILGGHRLKGAGSRGREMEEARLLLDLHMEGRQRQAGVNELRAVFQEIARVRRS